MTVELHKTTQHESEESKESEGIGRDEISENQNAEENIEKGERETKRRIDEKVVGNEDTKEVRTQTGEDNATHRQPTPFNWATDVDISDGLSPITLIDTSMNKSTAVDHSLVSTEPITVIANESAPDTLLNGSDALPPAITVNATSNVFADTTPITHTSAQPLTRQSTHSLEPAQSTPL